MKNSNIIIEIKKLCETYLLKEASNFSVDDHNSFEEKVWELKDKYNYKKSPFLLLPDPAKEADWFIMNKSKDGFVEPNIEDKTKYLSMMKESYKKILDSSKEQIIK